MKREASNLLEEFPEPTDPPRFQNNGYATFLKFYATFASPQRHKSPCKAPVAVEELMGEAHAFFRFAAKVFRTRPRGQSSSDDAHDEFIIYKAAHESK